MLQIKAKKKKHERASETPDRAFRVLNLSGTGPFRAHNLFAPFEIPGSTPVKILEFDRRIFLVLPNFIILEENGETL